MLRFFSKLFPNHLKLAYGPFGGPIISFQLWKFTILSHFPAQLLMPNILSLWAIYNILYIANLVSNMSQFFAKFYYGPID